jgi:hypothetical protein
LFLALREYYKQCPRNQREKTKYDATGRFQGESDALEMDEFVKSRLESRGKEFHEATTGDEILGVIRQASRQTSR